jgi:2-C-methyl-D-erythritol 2,4-cyclodiphosphate synthase
MAAWLPEMRQNIATACRVDVSRVNIKATTEERMGFTGEKLGLSAHAVCLLREECPG